MKPEEGRSGATNWSRMVGCKSRQAASSLRPAPERLINSIGRHLLQLRRYVRVDVGRYLIGRVPERLLHDLEGHPLGDEEARRPAPKLVEGEVPHAAGLRVLFKLMGHDVGAEPPPPRVGKHMARVLPVAPCLQALGGLAAAVGLKGLDR